MLQASETPHHQAALATHTAQLLPVSPDELTACTPFWTGSAYAHYRGMVALSIDTDYVAVEPTTRLHLP
jgi:hypothetical protein